MATGIAAALWLAAWTLSYLALGEGALRTLMSARVADDVFTAGPSLAVTIFSWNLLFGVGAIVVGSFFAIGRVSLGYFAPWWWALGYGVALGTNSFVLTVPGKLAPRLDILWQHIGAREILAYLLVAAALSNIHVWRPRRWHDLSLSRVRAFADIRLGVGELARRRRCSRAARLDRQRRGRGGHRLPQVTRRDAFFPESPRRGTATATTSV